MIPGSSNYVGTTPYISATGSSNFVSSAPSYISSVGSSYTRVAQIPLVTQQTIMPVGVSSGILTPGSTTLIRPAAIASNNFVRLGAVNNIVTPGTVLFTKPAINLVGAAPVIVGQNLSPPCYC